MGLCSPKDVNKNTLDSRGGIQYSAHMNKLTCPECGKSSNMVFHDDCGWVCHSTHKMIPDLSASQLAKDLWWALKVERAGDSDNPNEIKQFCMLSEEFFMRAITKHLREECGME